MKKKALHKDIYMTICRTLPRFLSIFFIVVLGVAFYAGIRVTEKDMKITADAQFDQNHFDGYKTSWKLWDYQRIICRQSRPFPG